MNWLLIVVILILAWNIVRGYTRGILRIAYSLLMWTVILVVAYAGKPYVKQYIIQHTQLESFVEEKISDKLQNDMLPKITEDNIINSTANALLEKTGVYDEVTGEIAGVAIDTISFVLIIIAGLIVFHLLYAIIGMIEKLPVIGQSNKVLGLGLGLVKGMIIVWILFLIIALCCTSDIGRYMISDIRESLFLKWIYDNNPLLMI